jgi:hypothetical protein
LGGPGRRGAAGLAGRASAGRALSLWPGIRTALGERGLGQLSAAILRAFSEARLLWMFGVEVERLLRIAEEHPSLAGGVGWTCAVLGASEHIAQVYAELKRRHKAMPARAMLREELRRFVEWDGCAEG